MIAIYMLLVFMIIGAIIAIQVKDLLSSVVAVGAVGLGFALVALILKAPDVAITQLVVEIVAVVILIRATLRRDLPESTTTDGMLTGLAALAFTAVVLLVAMKAFEQLPAFGAPLMTTSERYLLEGVKGTGATNVVSAILLDFRAYDTLGEATVLFTAAVGVLAVVRRVGRKEQRTAVEDEK